MKREEKIENILNDLVKSGSNISYLDDLKKDSLELLKKDSSLSELMDDIAKNLREVSLEFLNGKNDFDINYISGISSCIYLPSFDGSGEIKLKFIGGNKSRNFDIKVNEHTMFDVASITKLFTLVLAFQCENIGFDLNARVKDINPDYDLEDFTFNDLIRLCGELRTKGNVAQAHSKEEAYAILKTLYLNSNTREENQYTDFGAIVIGESLVKFLNNKFNCQWSLIDWMKTLIFYNINMRHTKFNPNDPNISGNGNSIKVHDPKARILGGAVGSAGIFTTSEDLARLAKSLFSVNYMNAEIEKFGTLGLTREQLGRFGEITYPNAKQCNKGNLGIYVKHPLGFAKTYTPSEFSTGSFSHQGWTGSVATFDPNNLIHQNILVNAIYESDNKDLVRNDKPVGFGDAFDEYLKQMTINTMLIFVAKKYYNTYCNSKEDVDKTYKLK